MKGSSCFAFRGFCFYFETTAQLQQEERSFHCCSLPFLLTEEIFSGSDKIANTVARRLGPPCVCSQLVLFPSLKDTSHTAAASLSKQISSWWTCKKFDFRALFPSSYCLANQLHVCLKSTGRTCWSTEYIRNGLKQVEGQDDDLRIVTLPSIKPSGARTPGIQRTWGEPMTRGLVYVT